MKNIKAVEQNTEVSEEKKLAIKMAKLFTDDVRSTALTISSLLFGEGDFDTLVQQINELTHSVIDGDTRRIESDLITQSKTLSVIFSKMVRCAVKSETMNNFKAYMDVGLRAQNQARKTLLALNTIKNPPQKQFVEQQNIAVNQQVNNGSHPTESKIKPENELLEKKDEQRLDTRTTQTSGKINPQLEAVAVSRR